MESTGGTATACVVTDGTPARGTGIAGRSGEARERGLYPHRPPGDRKAPRSPPEQPEIENPSRSLSRIFKGLWLEEIPVRAFTRPAPEDVLDRIAPDRPGDRLRPRHRQPDTGRAPKVVFPHAPGARPRRQGPELPQAGPRLVLPRPVRRPRRHPGRPRDDLPPGVRLPLPVLPRPDDLPRGGSHPRADPPQRHVEGLRRRFGRPAHVEPLRPARPLRLERLLLRLQPRAARRRPRPGHPVVRDEEPRLLLDGRVVHLRGVLLRGGQRLLAREAPGHLRHPGQRLRHLGPEAAADGEPLRLRQLRELPEPQGHPLRRQGRPRLGPRASRGRGLRPERRGVRPRPRRLRADPLPLQLRPARALPRRGRARRGERARPAPPLPPPPRRRGRLLRGGDPRDRGGEPAGSTRARRTAPGPRPTPIRSRSTTSSSPSPGSPRETAWRRSPGHRRPRPTAGRTGSRR